MSKVITRLVTAMALLALVAVPAAVGNGAANTGLWASDHTAQVTSCSSQYGTFPRDSNNFCYITNDGAVELGVRFTTSTALDVVGVRIYRVSANTVTGSLWDPNGASLATGTFSAYSGSHGWQDLIFDGPVSITPGNTYTASYHVAPGDYAFEYGYPFPATVGPITALGGSVNGTYQYCNPGPCFPNTASSLGTNYWVTPLWNANQPPTVDAGGPYSVDEGSSVSVSATGSDPDGGALTYAWDLDDDGTFETPGQTATFSAAAIDGPATQTIGVQATDPGGLSATATATVDIANVAPVVTSFTCPVNPVVLNTSVTLNGAFTDAGTADTHTASIAWADGSPSTAGTVTEASGIGTVSGSKTYSAVGKHSPTLTVIDDDGGSASRSCDLTVNYNWSGFLQPVDNPETVNKGKAGKTYPVKFQLRDANGAFVSSLSAVSSITYKSGSCGAFTGDPADALETEVTGSTSLRYDSTSNQYVYNWKTPSAVGCYMLFVTLDSGQVFKAYFNLAK